MFEASKHQKSGKSGDSWRVAFNIPEAK